MGIKIQDITSKSAKIASTDLIEIAQVSGATYVSRKVTGSEINELSLDTTPQLGGNLDVNGNSIVSTSNGNITIEPNGTGDILLNADAVRIGDSNTDATIATNGTGDLILTTNQGAANQGVIRIYDGANGNIELLPNGTGSILVGGNSTQATELRFMEDGDNGTNYVALKANDTLAANTTYTLPTADGTNGQVLQTNGSGVLSWSSASGGVPTTRNITINGTTQDLSADRTYTVTDANLSISDITTNNVSTTQHGFAPKLPNDATIFLDGTGAYSNPTPDWVDYTATSTVVGWSSFTEKLILYKKVGKQIFVSFRFSGTSNSTSVTFTVPDNNNSTSIAYSLSVGVTNNGATSTTPGNVQTTLNSNVITVNRDRNNTAWTNSGTKAAYGQFFYFID